MLGDLDAGAGDDQRRAGRDIVGARAIAAGADDVDGVRRRVDRRHLGAHGARPRRRSRPASRRAPAAPSGSRRSARASPRRTDEVEGLRRLVARQRLRRPRPCRQGLEVVHQVSAALPCGFHSAAKSRKFCRMRWPCSDSDDFGWNCTPCTGNAAMRQAHDDAVLGLGRDLSVVRHGLALDDQRMVARRLERAVDATEDAAALDGGSRRACRASARGARTTSPPITWPIA